MAYISSKSHSLTTEVSLQPNNLSIQGKDVVYVSLNEVIIQSLITGTSNKIPTEKKLVIYQASFVTIWSSCFLVIATSDGMEVWVINPLENKYSHSFHKDESSRDENMFSRGIASFDHGVLCVGNSQGLISIFRVPTRDGEGIEFEDSVETKSIPISALASSTRLLAAGNENGDIFGYNPHSQFSKVCKCPGNGYPCTSIVTREDSIIAAFSSGHIRTYRASLGEIAIELAAHARAIYGLALHPSLDILASCGEDQYMNVWTVPTFTSHATSEMDLLASCTVPNKKFTGVAINYDDRIGVVAYDDDEISFFEKSS